VDIIMSAHPEAFHFRDVTGALRRRWKMITVLGLTGALLATAVGLILPPRYTAKAQIVIEIPDTAATLGWLDDAAVESRVQLLMSVGHLRRLLESLASDTEHPSVASISYDILERNLNAYKELHSRVIAVTYTDSDPVLAAFVANKSAAIYLDTIADRWRNERGDIRALDAQIPVVKAKLQQVEATLQATRSASSLIGSKLADVAGTVQPSSREPHQSDVQLRNMEREAAATTQLYQNLLKRRSDLFSQEVPTQEVRIASLAVPPNLPSSLSPFLFLPPAVVIAMIMGAFLAITLERLDSSIRSQKDAVDALGIPCVALVPTFEGAPKPKRHRSILFARGMKAVRSFLASILQRVQSSQRFKALSPHLSFLKNRSSLLQVRSSEHSKVPSPHLSFLKSPFSPYSEAIRCTVMSTLKSVQEKGRPEIVLVTSSVQGEGKTTLAVSFAAYAALLERKVLLIDFDFRKPGVLEQLAGTDEAGTLEVLEGRPVADLIKHHPELGIDYLPLPRHRVDPLPLLQCANLPEFIKLVGKDYDCVVIDSAPLLGTTETRLLSAIVDKVLLAVQWGSTRRDIVEQAFRQMQAPGRARPDARAATVITKVDLKLHSLYRFGDVGEALTRFSYQNAQARRA
jgi:polysaccharide biosynthesis transport protein